MLPSCVSVSIITHDNGGGAMKRVALWMVTVGLVGFVAVVSGQAKERKPKAESAPQPAVQQAPQPPPVFTFSTDEDMQAFAKIWQQRQAALTRMSVLQGYWTQEQAAAEQVTQELASKYHLDPAKTYTLDVARKSLVEVERKEPAAPLEGQGAQLGQVPATAPATSSPQ